MNAVEMAVRAVGDKKTLAALVGVSQPAISYWVRVGRIPVDKVRRVSAVTGIPVHVLDDRFMPAKRG